MSDKFSYYDFLVNFVPGALLFWALIAATGSANNPSTLPTGNLVADSLMFIVLAYALGHLVQFGAKYTIEPIIRRLFWGGFIFSEWFLVKGHSGCSEDARQCYIDVARRAFGFTGEALSLLELPQKTEEEAAKAREVSQDIYRRLDSYAADKGVAVKATTQNAFYGFFRGLSLVSLVAGILFLVMAYVRTRAIFIFIGMGLLIAADAFMMRARERGEIYIRGLFDSIASHFTSSKVEQ